MQKDYNYYDGFISFPNEVSAKQKSGSSNHYSTVVYTCLCTPVTNNYCYMAEKHWQASKDVLEEKNTSIVFDLAVYEGLNQPVHTTQQQA